MTKKNKKQTAQPFYVNRIKPTKDKGGSSIPILDPPKITRRAPNMDDRYLLDINASGESFKSMVFHVFFHLFIFIMLPLSIVVSRVLNKRIKWFNVGAIPSEKLLAHKIEEENK